MNSKPAGKKDASSYLKVISDKNRLAILELLKSGERCVCEIYPELRLPQNLASHHLRVLKNFGLVKNKKDGLKIFYSLDKREISKFNSLLNKSLRSYE